MSPEEITPREFDLAIGTLTRAVADLGDQFRAGAEQSSREHAEVRGELRELRRQLDTGVPSAAEFRSLKEYLYGLRDLMLARLDVLEAERDRRSGGIAMLRGGWLAVVGLVATTSGVTGIVVALVGG